MIRPHEIPATGPAAALAAKVAASIPALATDRLELRAPRITDFDAYAEIVCGPRGTYVNGPMTRDDAWLDFTQLTAGWVLRGHGVWTVLFEGRIAGFVLLGFEPGDEEPELGFLFRDWAEGQGFAAEAARAARSFGFCALGLPSMVSYVAPANDRAVALATRLGARRDGMAETRLGDDVAVFRHISPAGDDQ